LSFDLCVAVDWSARSGLSPARETADAIWIGLDDGQGARAEYHRGRDAAMARLHRLLAEERGRRRRVLVGFDFAFGFPPGLAAGVTGRAEALAMWDWPARRIRDGPDNANNRFAVAQEINRHFPGAGPLWGRPSKLDLPDLPERGSARTCTAVPDRRAAEDRLPRAHPVVKLYTTGSVGSQTLLGLPRLAALRREFPEAKVWPLETGFTQPRAPIVLVELYLSIWPPRAHPILDAGQVLASAERMRRAPASWFSAPGSMTDHARIATEEGWVFGLGPTGVLDGGGAT
jgi:molybdopterin molybdotransferase